MLTCVQPGTQQSLSLKSLSEKEKNPRSTKDQAQRCTWGTWECASPLDGVMFLEKTGSTHRDTPRTGCPVISPSGTEVSRSSLEIPSGPLPPYLHLHPMLYSSSSELTWAWNPTCRTSSGRPSCTWLDGWRFLLGLAWFAAWGRTEAHPWDSSQTPCSSVQQN